MMEEDSILRTAPDDDGSLPPPHSDTAKKKKGDMKGGEEVEQKHEEEKQEEEKTTKIEKERKSSSDVNKTDDIDKTDGNEGLSKRALETKERIKKLKTSNLAMPLPPNTPKPIARSPKSPKSPLSVRRRKRSSKSHEQNPEIQLNGPGTQGKPGSLLHLDKDERGTEVSLDEKTMDRLVEQILAKLQGASASMKTPLLSPEINTSCSSVGLPPVAPLNQTSTQPVTEFQMESLNELNSIKQQKSVSYATRESIRKNSEKRKSLLMEGVSQIPHRASILRTERPSATIGKTSPTTKRPTLTGIATRLSRVLQKGGDSEQNKSAAVTPLGLHNIKRIESTGSTGISDDIQHIKEFQNAKTMQKHFQYLDKNLTQAAMDEAKQKRAKSLKERYPELWDSFQRYDQDKSGEIDAKELASYLEVELGFEVSDRDIEKFFKEVDENNDGAVSFLELAEWYHHVVNALDLRHSSTHSATVGNIFNFARFQSVGDSIQQLVNPRNPSILAPYGQDSESASRWIIHPQSIFHAMWDLSISFILVITVLTLPLTMAFEPIHQQLFVFNIAIDIIFLMDVIKNFFTGFENEDGFVQMEPRKVVRHYVFGWFIPDLVSSIPIDLVLDNLDTMSSDPLARSAKGLKMLRLVRMTKLLRLLRVGRAAKYVNFYRRFLEDKLKMRIHESTISVLKLGLLLFVMAHWLGCVEFMICRLMDFPESSWVRQGRVNEMNVGSQYSWSFYKALGQMIGVGYETPPVTNLSCMDLYDDWCVIEMWVTLASMYLGSIFYAIMISSISSIIFSMNYAARLYNEKTQQINEYMRSKHLPPGLRDKVRDYFALRYSEGKIFNEEAIMKDLSPALRREIMIFTSRELFLKVPFFRSISNGFISSLATSLTPVVAFHDDIIIEEGTTGDSMFFISSGKVQIYVEEFITNEDDKCPPDMDQEKWLAEKGTSKITVIATIGEGCFFGEVALLLPVRRTASVKSKSVTIMHSLERESLLTALKDFPEIYERLRDIATSRVKRITRKLKRTEESRGAQLTLDRDLQDMQAAKAFKERNNTSHVEQVKRNPFRRLSSISL